MFVSHSRYCYHLQLPNFCSILFIFNSYNLPEEGCISESRLNVLPTPLCCTLTVIRINILLSQITTCSPRASTTTHFSVSRTHYSSSPPAPVIPGIFLVFGSRSQLSFQWHVLQCFNSLLLSLGHVGLLASITSL